jgi:hypothetical protein
MTKNLWQRERNNIFRESGQTIQGGRLHKKKPKICQAGNQ